MELLQMRYFLAVAREQNISRAAELLFITQPSLTRQIQNMEKEVGRPLFVRGGRKLRLTEAGALLQKRAEEILSLYEKTESELLCPENGVSGDVFIGGAETHAMQFLTDAAAALRQTHPDVRFHIHSGDIADICERLDKGLVDFGLLIAPADVSGYECLRLPVKDRWGALVRKDHPLARKTCVTPEDLAGEPLIVSKHALAGGILREWFGETRPAEPAATYNLLYNAALMALSGIGCVISIDKIVNMSGESGLSFLPLSPALESPVFLVWKKHQLFSSAAQRFLKAVREKA